MYKQKNYLPTLKSNQKQIVIVMHQTTYISSKNQ